MAEIYRGHQGAASMQIGRTRCAIPGSTLSVQAGPLTFAYENKVSFPGLPLAEEVRRDALPTLIPSNEN